MDPLELKKAFWEVLEWALPEVVEKAVETKTGALKTEIDNLSKEVGELNKTIKFSSGEEKKDLYSKTAKFFKTLVKKSPEFIEAKAAFLNEWTDWEGWELVPTEFAREVLRVAKDVWFARKYCRIIPMSTDKKDISKIISWVTVYWTAEGVAYTGSKPGTGAVQLICNKLTALVSGTNELIDDNQTDEEVFNIVRDLIGEAIAEFEDTQVMSGNGTAPNFPGIFTAGTSIPTQSLATGHDAFADIDYQDLVKIKNKVPKKYLKSNRWNIAWTMSQDVYTYIEALVDKYGRPLLKESVKKDSEETLLLGYPIEIVAWTPSTDWANVNMLAFGNFYYYLLGDRKTLSFEFGYATGWFETDIQSMKANERIAGKPAFLDAFVVAKTSAT